MSLRRETIELLMRYGIRPRQDLGQTFLINESIAKKIVRLAEVKRAKVLEIGAGLGALTRFLVEEARMVYAVEVDPKLLNILRSHILPDCSNLVLIGADFLELSPPQVDVVVSNMPYSVATPILFKLLRECSFKRALLTLQKELALRIMAEPGSRDYGRLTVSIRAFCEPQFLMFIGKENFYPIPEVDSAVIKLVRQAPAFKIEDLNLYLDLARALFTQRNKLLRKALPLSIKGVLKIKINPSFYEDDAIKHLMKLRVRELRPEDVALISNVLKRYMEAT